MLRIVLAAAATTAASIGLIGAATAAPAARVDGMSHTQVSSHEVFVQTVHWERRSLPLACCHRGYPADAAPKGLNRHA